MKDAGGEYRIMRVFGGGDYVKLETPGDMT